MLSPRPAWRSCVQLQRAPLRYGYGSQARDGRAAVRRQLTSDQNDERVSEAASQLELVSYVHRAARNNH